MTTHRLVGLAELDRLRVNCPECAACLEVAVRDAALVAMNWKCPHCHAALASSYGDKHPLREFADALNWLRKQEEAARIEFSLPAPE
jgi:endogenous inhibitor of DNA gyrase (YacG/DUF329 family)